MRRTLSTPNDVITFSGADKRISPCTFDQLYQIERREARKCLGLKFWTKMISALADYSDAKEYVSGEEYEEGDVVVYKKGIYRIAIKDTTLDPVNSSDWEDAPKFDASSECGVFYEDLYNTFLGPYLGHTVLSQRLPYVWTKILSVGVVEYNGESFDSASDKAYDRLLGAIHRDKNNAWGNLDDYLVTTYKDIIDGTPTEVAVVESCIEDFPSIIKSDSSSCCKRPGCKGSCSNGRRASGRTRWG